MPFILSYAEFKSPEFEHALAKLSSMHYQDEKVGYNIAKILRRFRQESSNAQKKWEALYGEYVMRDEKGAIVPLDGRPGTFTIRAELSEKWEAACEAYNATKVEFDCHRLTPETCKEAKLTPKDLVDLESLLGFTL